MSAVILLAAATLATATVQDEAASYSVDYLTPPDGAVLEVGGMGFLPDGRLAVSTRRGQVWFVEDPLADDPSQARFTLFAEGLWEGLGLAVHEGELYVAQRGELSRLIDVDGDDLCDVVETVSDDWGLSGNYHEFGYGLPIDADGNFYMSLNVSFFSPKWWHGKSTVPYRGWAIRIAPDGTVTPYASGFRSPCGISLSPEGELFITDNQGDWMAASPVFLVKQGGFHGHPASLDWTDEYRASGALASDTIPPAAAADRVPPAIWLPYKWSRSPGNLAWDESDGAFGPFAGQTYIAELTNGMVLRSGFEEHRGVRQGWVVPFRQKIGSVVRLLFSPGGETLFCGFTNRGWGGVAPADGLARIRYTGTSPFEIESVALLQNGFRVRMTHPVSEEWVKRTEPDSDEPALGAVQYDYDYWWEYGSPERETTPIGVSTVAVDGRDVTLTFDELVEGRMARVRFFDMTDVHGAPLLHDEFAYTINVLPHAADDGSQPTPIARVVPPPPSRASGAEGWLRLTYGDAVDAWYQTGWELVAAELDPDDPTRFRITKGNSHLTNTGEAPSDFISKAEFGDMKVHVDFTLPEGASTALYAMGAYGLRLSDSTDDPVLTTEHCGAVIGGEGFEGHAPELHAYVGAGQMHGLDFEFRAPRFDAEGNKTENAAFVRVMIDDVLLHENVELPGPSDGATHPESALGPLVFLGGQGHIAIGNVKVRPIETVEGEGASDAGEGYEELVDLEADEPLAGWTITEDGYWYVEDDVLIGEGPRSHLFSPQGDLTDFDLRAEMKLSDGGNSGLLLRAPMSAEGWAEGYEVELNCSFASPEKTGSIVGRAPILTHLVSPDTWFELDVSCRTEAEGTRIRVHLNGILVNDYLDPDATFRSGHVALQQHHDGSVLEVRRLAIRTR